MRADTLQDLNQLLTKALALLAETETELVLVEALITQHEEELMHLWSQVQNARRKSNRERV